MTPVILKAARKKLNLTQAQLVAALGMRDLTGRHICKWEAGTSKVPGPVALAVKCLRDHKDI